MQNGVLRRRVTVKWPALRETSFSGGLHTRSRVFHALLPLAVPGKDFAMGRLAVGLWVGIAID